MPGLDRAADRDPDPLPPGKFGSTKITSRHNRPRSHGNYRGRATRNIDKRVIWLLAQITGDYLGLLIAIGHYSFSIGKQLASLPVELFKVFKYLPWS